jgi:DNA (cytosine-5)-methyltransferase 1
MRELSLFSGAGGGLLGTYLLGWKHIGYVEFNDYCQRVIRQRIIDGILPNAPIFGDVRTFISDGYAASYQGMVDVITGGFPCQPFSVAGKRAGADDPRNMWPATRDCVRIVRPRHCFFENVPGLLNSGYFGTIVNDLAESGYCVRWRILSAAEVGAPHKRDRLWIYASVANAQYNGQPSTEGQHQASRVEFEQRWAQESPSIKQSERSNTRSEVSRVVSHTNNKRLEERQGITGNNGKELTTTERSCHVENAQRLDCGAKEISSQVDRTDSARSTSGISRPSWWEVEPDVGRMADGIPARVDRLKALGNGQVPAVVRAAWNLLSSDFVE